MSSQQPSGGKQISVAGVLAYTTLWALVIGLFRQVAKLQEGTYSIAEARLADVLMLVATGLLFVAIGLPVAIFAGRSRQIAQTSFGCFFVGILAIPILVVILATLSSFGVINLD